jgi:hypothetical protein
MTDASTGRRRLRGVVDLRRPVDLQRRHVPSGAQSARNRNRARHVTVHPSQTPLASVAYLRNFDTSPGSVWGSSFANSSFFDFSWNEDLKKSFAYHFFHLLWNVELLIYFVYMASTRVPHRLPHCADAVAGRRVCRV